MKKIIIKHLEDILFNLENEIYNNMYEKENNQDIKLQIYFLQVIIYFIKSNNFRWIEWIKKVENAYKKGDI